jgi:hypothetical protein
VEVIGEGFLNQAILSVDVGEGHGRLVLFLALPWIIGSHLDRNNTQSIPLVMHFQSPALTLTANSLQLFCCGLNASSTHPKAVSGTGPHAAHGHNARLDDQLHAAPET